MSIVLIDLELAAGCNAVVIATTVRNLPGKTRQWGIVLGAGGVTFSARAWRKEKNSTRQERNNDH
jgi:predicted tellurium resistance membrane protein TerC